MSAVKVTFSPLARLTHPSGWGVETHITTIAVAILGIILASTFLLHPTKDGNIYDLGGLPLITAWSFFTKRWDFIHRHFATTGGKMFRFRVVQVGFTDPFRKFCDFNRISPASRDRT